MHASNRGAFTNVTQILLDVMCLVAAYAVADLLTMLLWNPLSNTRFFWMLLAFPVVFLFLMKSQRMYASTTFMYRDRVVRNILSSALCAAVFCIAIIPFIGEHAMQNRFLGVYLLAAVALMITQRFVTTSLLHGRAGRNSVHCLAVGETGIIDQYRYYIGKTAIRTHFVGWVSTGDTLGTCPVPRQGMAAGASFDGSLALTLPEAAAMADPQVAQQAQEDPLPLLGPIEALERILTEQVVDEVLFALPRDYMGGLEPYVQLCEARGLTVKLALDLYDLNVAKTHVHSIGTIPVLTYHTVTLNTTQLFLKRCLDIAGALAGLVILGVASVFVVPAIKLDSKGPVFFKQNRVGQNGRIFKLYKFRSMCADAEAKKKALQAQNRVKGGLMFKMDHDPRITKVGAFIRKTSIDELPQFINVLKGEMSLVGTRPPTLDEVDKYQNLHHRRISIKPGITGMWQVSGRSDIKDFDEVCRLDTSYIDDWTVWSDIRIILKTIAVIFRRKGAI